MLFFGIASFILASIHYYLWQRLVRAPELGDAYRRWGTALIIFFAVLTPASMAISRALPRPAQSVVAWIAYSWMGLAIILLFLLLGSELVRGAVRVVDAALSRPMDPARRTLISRGIAGAVGLLAVGIAGAGAVSATGRVGVKNVKVPLRRLPREVSGFRIAQITDVHVGPTIGQAFLQSVVDQINALAPDMIVITGDLVDGKVATLRDQVAPLLELRAKHGIYFVTGNHEYYAGVDEWVDELTRMGIRVLRNEHVRIGDGDLGFDLAGVDDFSARRYGRGHGANLERALEGRDPSRELVLLAHQPKQIIEAAARGVGLQLSGHTHGGQIFPWGFLVGIDQPYVAGLALHGDTHIYVSRGTGYWGPPMRVAAPSEITLIELVAA
jgi:uncharacterized protein